MKKIVRIALILLLAIAITWIIYLLVRPAPSPWVESGRMTLLVRTIPGPEEDTMFGVGLDNMELFTKDGDVKRVTVRTRRLQLTPGSDTLTLVLDTSVPTGEYVGFGFDLKSPELRNEWEQDIAPESVQLAHEHVRLDVPYSIQPDTTTAIVLAFETLRAIHEKEGQQFYLPVIQIETRSNATVTESNDATGATVSGGVIQHSATFGMDWEGVVRHNYRERKAKKQERNDTDLTPIEDTLYPKETIEKQATSTEQATSTNEEVGTDLDNV